MVVEARSSANEDIRELADRLTPRHAFAVRTNGRVEVGGTSTERVRVRPRAAGNGEDQKMADVVALAEHIDAVLGQAGKGAAAAGASFDDMIGQVISPRSPLVRELIDRYPEKVDQWVLVLLQADDYSHQVRNAAYAIASAYVGRDSKAASALFDRLGLSPPTSVLLEGIPLAQVALFAAADVPALNSLREEAFRDLFDDGAIELITIAAERCGAGSWLDTFIEKSLTSPIPGDIARALTIAGFRPPNGQSEELLARQFEQGFLGDVAENARKNYRRDAWARAWLSMAAAAPDGVTFWRAGVLATGVIDMRTEQILHEHADGPLVRRYGEELTKRLVKEAEKRSKERKATLFGLRAPPQDLVNALRSR